MVFRYEDPVADAEAYYNELARLEEKLPVCSCCNRPVMEDYFYEINDEVICAECLDRHFKKEVTVD